MTTITATRVLRSLPLGSRRDTCNPIDTLVLKYPHFIHPEFMTHISVVVTSDNWGNFLDLRDHPDADPTMQVLAKAVRQALETPGNFNTSGWHLPFITDADWTYARANHPGAEFKTLARISATRCARGSYLNHDGTQPNWGADTQLAFKLWSSQQLSPFEHQAYQAYGTDDLPALRGNFSGWNQFRKVLEHGAM